MIVSNTTPFIALCSIGELEIYPKLFGSIHVAKAVADECRVGGPVVVPDLEKLDWVKVHKVSLSAPTSRLWMLDAGERDTIELALALNAERVVIDEKIGRNIAELMGLSVVGTLGVLAKAKERRLIDSFTDAAQRMREAGIRFHPNLISRIAAQIGEGAE